MTFYNANTPTIQLPFAQWQRDFLDNFTVMGSDFARNHVPLDAAVNAGNHVFIELLEQFTAPTTKNAEFSIYTKDVEDQTDQVFMRYSGNGKEFQFTNYQIYPISPIVVGVAVQELYFTFLPGGIICYFGSYTATGVGLDLEPKIMLIPPVAKNVISVNSTPFLANSTPQSQYNNNSTYDLLKEGDYIKAVVPHTFIPKTFTAQYYIVLANI